MRIRRATIAAVLTGLVVAGCTGSTDSGDSGISISRLTATGDSIDTIVMIGDSITVGSKPEITAALEELGFGSIVIQSQSSKRTAVGSAANASGVAVAESLLADADELSDPTDTDTAPAIDADHSDELWILALGTNDINQYSNETDITAAFEELTAVVPAEAALIWVDTYFRDEPEGAAAVNAVIEAEVAERGNATVARWSLAAADEGNLRVDGLHPSEQGALAFASTISNTIVEFLQLG